MRNLDADPSGRSKVSEAPEQFDYGKSYGQLILQLQREGGNFAVEIPDDKSPSGFRRERSGWRIEGVTSDTVTLMNQQGEKKMISSQRFAEWQKNYITFADDRARKEQVVGMEGHKMIYQQLGISDALSQIQQERIREITGERKLGPPAIQEIQIKKELPEQPFQAPQPREINSKEQAAMAFMVLFIQNEDRARRQELGDKGKRLRLDGPDAELYKRLQSDEKLKYLLKMKIAASNNPSDPEFLAYASQKLQGVLVNLPKRVQELGFKTNRTAQEEQAFLIARTKLKEYNDIARQLGITIQKSALGDVARQQKAQEASPVEQVKTAQPVEQMNPAEKKPEKLKEITAGEIGRIIKEGLARNKNTPSIWDDILRHYGLSSRVAANLDEANKIFQSGLPFHIEEMNGKYEIIWPARGKDFSFISDIIKDRPQNYSQVVANYLNQALINSRR